MMCVKVTIRNSISILLLVLLVHVESIANDDPGSRLLPVPRKVSLSSENFQLNKNWALVYGTGISREDAAATSLVDEIKDRFGFELKRGMPSSGKSPAIRLEVKEGAVQIGKSTDTNRAEIMKQAYRLKLDANGIVITANASAGLYYGAQTLLQLLTSANGNVTYPKGMVEDWPDLELRIIYWDDAHHLEKPKALKRAIRQAAHYKINGFALKLEGHFQYKKAKPIVEPYAYTPAEYQELTSYAKSHQVNLIPFLDCPAHVSFILKHPEFAQFRAYPDNNYEFSVVNPKADELILSMFNELFDANKGVKYVFLSTDEAYYVGKPDNEKDESKKLGGNGKLLAKYISKISNELHKRGRTSMIWGEYPLTKDDITSLPNHIVNAVYDGDVAPIYKRHGIRQVIYTSTQGVEPLFPEYYSYPKTDFIAADTTKSQLLTDDEMQQGELSKGRVEGLLRTISNSIAEKKSDFMGTVVAGWGDSGLNPETFWLGYAAGSAVAWNHEGMTSQDLTQRFFYSFYGSDADNMKKIYQLLSSQAQFWNDSWEWAPLQLRTPILGNSEGIFDQPRHLKDQTLLPLPVPSTNDLALNKDWNALNTVRLKAAARYLEQNSELLNLLHETLRSADRQQFNLRVLISVANLCRQNLELLLDLESVNELVKLASSVSSKDPIVSVSLIDHALDRVKATRDQRNETLRSLVSVWYEEWFPRVAEANGRVFLDKVDDVKDHVPVRTVDMSYLIYRQLNYPLGKWAEEMRLIRNKMAEKNSQPPRTEVFDWKNTSL